MQDLNELSGPVLIFGGPYSNFQATHAMQQQAMHRGIAPENVICNGDLVAYCADPETTVDLVRDWGIHVVMGNCEESIGNQEPDCGCGFEQGTLCSTLSIDWYNYANARVSPGNRLWMRNLPRQITFSLAGKRFAVIHGGVEDISEFVFDSSDAVRKQSAAANLGVDCVVGGHCGLPFGNQLEQCYWLNTGVIGMPANDGSTSGWYLLLESLGGNQQQITASWHRLIFDSAKSAVAMQQAGLGADYRNTLLTGLWPSMDVLPEKEKSTQGLPLTLTPMNIV